MPGGGGRGGLDIVSTGKIRKQGDLFTDTGSWLKDTRIIRDHPKKKLRRPWAGLDHLPLYSGS